MTPIPFWVTEMNECCNGNKEVETEFENLEIGSSHGRMKGRDLGVTNDAPSSAARHPIFSARHSCRHIILNFHHAPTLSNRFLLLGYPNPCRKRAQLLRLGRAFGKRAPQ